MERESMEFDVVIVGAGPSGLSAAIRLKQMATATGGEISVCVIEKGSEVGAHILSGAVVDPIALDELLPDWREDPDRPLRTPVTEDRFLVLSEVGAIRIPNVAMPRLMSNHGNFIVSLGNVCLWLAAKAEALGVEIYPGFAAAEVLFDDAGAVRGVATGDMGIGRDGERTAAYTPGMELHARYTFFAEGARGSLSKSLMGRFGLRDGVDPQKFGIGLKELWQIDPAKHEPGLVIHSQGWPLSKGANGGSFLYHLEDNQVAVGFVVHLDYENPHLSPFDEFQRFKTHPAIRGVFEGGKRISYGARAINEGGLQSVPKLVFPGGALIGCAAGFVNLPRIKGTHNAMKTGMLAAEAAFAAVSGGRANDVLAAYEAAWKESWVFQDLWKVRNVKPGFRWGALMGTLNGGVQMWANDLGLGRLFGRTMRHTKADHESLKPAAQCKPIIYPKPDGVLTFDRLSSVFVSNTNHEEDQPVHLVLKDPSIPIAHNLPTFDEPAQRYCPAGVYEVVRDDQGTPRFQINAQNCVHCKTCDIKDPTQNIEWRVPQGGGGPNYPNM
jgi:electron-transferring-flavoprotein dehydrogenase